MKLLYCLLFCINSAATLTISQSQILAAQPQTPIENLAKSITVYIDGNRAIQLDPTRASTYINRGLVYSALGDKAAARIDLQKSADLYHSQGNQVRYQEVVEQIRQMNK
jgi:lipoprotein NlpI